MTDVRPVWLDERLAGAIAYAEARARADWKDDTHAAELREILNAWEVAPANVAVNVRDTLILTVGIGGMERCISPVLRALGMPDAHRDSS